MLLAAALAQAVAGPVLPPQPRSLRSDAPRPVEAVGGDVVACARRDDHDRLRPLPPGAVAAVLPKAQVRVLGNAVLAAEAEQATLAGGQQSHQLMIRLKRPIGGRKK